MFAVRETRVLATRPFAVTVPLAVMLVAPVIAPSLRVATPSVMLPVVWMVPVPALRLVTVAAPLPSVPVVLRFSAPKSMLPPAEVMLLSATVMLPNTEPVAAVTVPVAISASFTSTPPVPLPERARSVFAVRETRVSATRPFAVTVPLEVIPVRPSATVPLNTVSRLAMVVLVPVPDGSVEPIPMVFSR